jgi:hypothetical protein
MPADTVAPSETGKLVWQLDHEAEQGMNARCFNEQFAIALQCLRLLPPREHA